MNIDFDQLTRLIPQTTYSDQDILVLCDQLTKKLPHKIIEDTKLEIKAISNQRNLAIRGKMNHSQYAPIEIQLLIYQPVGQIIQVIIINPQPNQLIFHQKYQSGDNLKYVYQRELFTIEETLLQLKQDIENQYPFIQLINQQAEAQIENKIDDQLKKILDEVIGDWQQLKNIEKNLKATYKQSQQKRAFLKQILNDLDQKTTNYREETQILDNFRKENNDRIVDENNILEILSLSINQEQELNLQAEIQGDKESFRFMVYQFQHSNVTLENLMSTARKLAEQEFWDRQLLKKCQQRANQK